MSFLASAFHSVISFFPEQGLIYPVRLPVLFTICHFFLPLCLCNIQMSVFAIRFVCSLLLLSPEHDHLYPVRLPVLFNTIFSSFLCLCNIETLLFAIRIVCSLIFSHQNTNICIQCGCKFCLPFFISSFLSLCSIHLFNSFPLFFSFRNKSFFVSHVTINFLFHSSFLPS